MWTKVNSPASVYCGFHFSNFCETLTSEQLLKYSYTKFNENMKFVNPLTVEAAVFFSHKLIIMTGWEL